MVSPQNDIFHNRIVSIQLDKALWRSVDKHGMMHTAALQILN